MPETYPDDATLLALTQDDATGVEYIPTGESPYVTSYRRMLYRLLRATERANDLRVYELGGRSIGVRAGRCFVGDQPRDVPASAPIELTPDATTHVYVADDGSIATSTSGLPTDRANFIPLAEVMTNADRVTTLIDLRGEAMLQAQTAALAGITAEADDINRALDGIDASVTAAHLSALTAGPLSTADTLHRHLATGQDVDGPAIVSFTNLSSDAAATVGLDFALPLVMPGPTRLQVDRDTGYFQQQYQGASYHLLGTTSLQWLHAGELNASAIGQLAGCVPIDGQVVDVILSTRLNTQSSAASDGLTCAAAVNGQPFTATSAQLTSADGSGLKSTDQGDGTAATIVTNGDQAVTRGDLVTIDLTYSAAGTISQAPADAAVVVVIKADAPA
jgi:hypothetical protein